MTRRFAGNVRAEMARQNKSIGELAEVLGVTPHTAGRRYNGKVEFSATEVMALADWLSVELSALLTRPAAPVRAAS